MRCHCVILYLQDSYKKVVEFYGENSRSISPAQFFSQIVRFVNSFKVGHVYLSLLETIIVSYERLPLLH